MSFFAKALMPLASSLFRKAVPSVLGGIRSFFSKAPSLQKISSGLGKVSQIGNQVVNNPYADVLASQLGGSKSLNVARQGLSGLDKVQKVTNEASNILEKVKAGQSAMKPQQAVIMPPRMPVAFGGEMPVVVGRGFEGLN